MAARPLHDDNAAGQFTPVSAGTAASGTQEAAPTTEGDLYYSPARGHTDMHWLWVFIVGLVVGIIAKLITPGKDPGGFIITAILGIIGSVLATWVGERLGWWPATGLTHFIASIVGAIILLVIYHAVFRRNVTS